MRMLFMVLLLKCTLFAEGKAVNDTLILFDFFQARTIDLRHKLNEDALRVIVNKDSFLLDARSDRGRMRLNTRILPLSGLEIRNGHAFFYTARFAGIRIIIPEETPADIRIQNVKTTSPNKFNNENFDTLLKITDFKTTHTMLWNVYFYAQSFRSLSAIYRFTDKYQMHSVNLPQVAEIRTGKRAKQRMRRIQKPVIYEVNLVTGIITNYKTGEQRAVKQ